MDFIRNMVYARTDANEKHNGCVCDRTHQRAKRYQYIGGLRMMKKCMVHKLYGCNIYKTTCLRMM